MQSRLSHIAIALSILAIFSCQTNKTKSSMSEMYAKSGAAANPAPLANKIEKKLEKHGDVRIDNYYWLNERENSDVISYLEAENEYRENMMSHLKDYQEKLFEEIKGRVKQTDMSVPYKDNGYFYFTRYEEGLEYPIYSRKKASLDADEEVLLNVNDLAEGFEFYTVGGRSVSPDNKILAYSEDTLSRRLYTLKFKNLKTGELYPEEILNTSGGATWANDNKTVFYTSKDIETLRPEKIWRHVLGTDQADDVMIYHESDDTFIPFIYKSKSKKYLIQGSYHTLMREFRILEADNPTGEFRVFEPRKRDLEYSISHFGDKFYVITNLDAKNFRLMDCPEGQTGKESWREVIAHRDDVLLEGMEVFNNYLVLSERKNGITQIRVRPSVGDEYYIDFGEDAYVAYTSVNPEFDTDILRIGYQSMTTPSSTYDYNMVTKERDLLKRQEVLGGFDPANYRSERVYAKARDGAMVPISLVYHKDTKIDGTAPCLIYGYGSYGASMEPSFGHTRLSLLDRGFVYAIAHIRGGEEMGRYWYEDGKKLNKKNTFTDFIDCGEYLVSNKYSAGDELYAMGGSAGGLLMGAVVNMRPDMWKGMIAAVPFVDVVTTMLDESIPLTTGEYDEWGDPNEKNYYDYMLSYSPYDNVTAQDYPALLITTGLHDSQVQYFEPAKWVAKLREYKTDHNPLMMYCNMETGHGGASGRFERFKETAMEWAFLIDLAGKAESDPRD
jgi:oligopeptidase B